MVLAICIGRGGSKGFPGKNEYEIDGLPMMVYPLLAAKGCEEVTDYFFSTEDPKLKSIAIYYGAAIIERPPELATDEALGEDAFVHAYNEVKNSNIEFVVLLFANAPCVTSKMMSEMIHRLREKPYYDSICTLSKYNMFSPYRMRRDLGTFGVTNFVRPVDFGNIDCDRDSSGNFYIYDCSCAVVRPSCLENIEDGFPPQKWLGQKILPYYQEIPALDLDYEWQLGQIEYWLKKHR